MPSGFQFKQAVDTLGVWCRRWRRKRCFLPRHKHPPCLPIWRLPSPPLSFACINSNLSLSWPFPPSSPQLISSLIPVLISFPHPHPQHSRNSACSPHPPCASNLRSTMSAATPPLPLPLLHPSALTCRWCIRRPGVAMMMSGLSASAVNCLSMLSPPTSSAIRRSFSFDILRANVSVYRRMDAAGG